MSGDPEYAAQRMAAADISADRAVSLPLQSDANLFGLLQASTAGIMANGFMQMTEALALGCPVVLVDLSLIHI